MRPVKLLSICLSLLILCSFNKPTENPPFQQDDYFYVVIGAFSILQNAERYKNWAQERELNARMALNPLRNLYYVYSLQAVKKGTAISAVMKVRALVEDAWVFTGNLTGVKGQPLVMSTTDEKFAIQNPGDDYIDESKTNTNQTDLDDSLTTNESGENSVDSENTSNNSNTNSSSNVTSGSDASTSGTSGDSNSNNTSNSETDNNSAEVSTDSTSITNQSDNSEVFIEDENTSDEELRGKLISQLEEEPDISEDYKVYVNTVNSQNLKEVVGRLDVLDIIRNRKMKEVTSHNLVGLNDPKNGSGAIEVATRFFGFRPLSVQFSLTDPASDTTGNISTIGDSILIDMPLEPLQHGDLTVLWNVLYFKDAAIMRPESRAELNSLLKFMQSNPNYNVVLHGHTNGSSSGKIIHLNSKDKDYFSMSGAEHKDSKGSAKKLSEERAYTIQQWLSDQGIDPARTTIRGWGGKRMLFEQEDPRAFLNVRVEVEVLDPNK